MPAPRQPRFDHGRDQARQRTAQGGDFTALDTRDFAPDLFDLVVIDPPYDIVNLERAVEVAAALVAPGGRLVAEHSRRRASPEAAGLLRRVRLLVAGDSALSFYAEGSNLHA